MTDPVVDPSGGDDPEHVAAMLKRADGEAPADPAVTGETLLAGKYKSVEELEKGYRELQTAFSSRDKADPPAADPVDPVTSPADPVADPVADPAAPNADLPPQAKPDADAADEGADPDGIDFDKYTNSFLENDGALTEDDYAELATKGLPKAAVDIYIAGLQSKMDARGKAAVDAVGSQEQFQAVREWASQNLDEAEFNAVQSQIRQAQTDAEVALVYRMLNTRYSEANPTRAEPTLVSGHGTAESKAGFSNRSDMIAAINDPRYAKDSTYRAEVERKVGNSPFM